MDVMKPKILGAAFATLLAAGATSAQAEEFHGALRYGAGLKEFVPAPRVAVPAPSYVPAPIPVPMGMPVPEGFTYYLRADLGWGFSGDTDYSETGRVFGAGAAPFISTGGPFSSSSLAGMGDGSSDGVFLGTVGMGMYFTPRLRGDITLDFRSKQDIDAEGTYAFTSTSAATTVTGVVRDQFSVSRAVALANLYFDLMPRGSFSPYIGAGIGLVYNDATRTYTDIATAVGVTPGVSVVTGSGSDTNVALAGALMAGVTFAWSHAWAIDVGYRALYLGGIDVSAPLTSGETSKATLDGAWEQEVRVGLRFNLW